MHWAEVGSALGEANYLFVALAVALMVLTIGLRAMRWRLLFHPIAGLRLWHLFGSLNTAYLINNVLPFQMGDLARAYLLSELAGVSTTRSLSSVLVERVLDVLTLLALLLVAAPFVGFPGWARAPAATLAVGFSLLLLTGVLAALRRDLVTRLVDRALRLAPVAYRPRLLEVAHRAIDGFLVLTRPRIAAGLIAYSALTWLSMGLVLYTTMTAFDLDLGYAAALLVLVATTFGLFVPSSPGAFGVYHAIVIGVLTSVFDIEKSAAVSYALVVHLVLYLPPIFIATGFLLKEHRFWRDLDVLAKLRSLRTPEEVADQTA